MMIMMDRRKAGGQICSVELLAQVSKKLERSYWSWYSASMSNFTRKQTKSSFKGVGGGGGQNWQKN